MRKCHHCHVEAPEKEIKYWPNGAGLCIPCYKEADEKDEALYKKIMEEISGKNVMFSMDNLSKLTGCIYYD